MGFSWKREQRNKYRYNTWKSVEKRKGEEYFLTFEEWESFDHIPDKPRGRKQGEYLLVKINENEPWSMSNATLILNKDYMSEHSKKYWKNNPDFSPVKQRWKNRHK